MHFASTTLWTSGTPLAFFSSMILTTLRRYSSAGYQFWFPINPVDLSNVTTKMGEIAPWQCSYWFNITMTKHGEFGRLAVHNQFEYSSHEVGMDWGSAVNISLDLCVLFPVGMNDPFWLSSVWLKLKLFEFMMRKQVIRVLRTHGAEPFSYLLKPFVKSLWLLRHGYGR